MTDVRTGPARVEAFIERARALTDDDRQHLATAREAIDETFHAGAWRAAIDVVVQHGRDLQGPWVRIGAAFIPARLDDLVQTGARADRAELERWQQVAKLARLAMEDALLALTAADLLRPPDLRELYAPWKAMLEAAHGPP